MLTIENVETYYGTTQVLHGVNLDVEDGSVTTLMGRNGVGKTTLVKSIFGFQPIREGKIIFNEEDITSLSTDQIVRRGVALIPQGRRVFGSLSVEENLRIAYRPSSISSLNWNLERVYELFPRLGERRKTRARQLSGGEQQMLASGRALVTNPKCLLMDEPTEGLAPTIVQTMSDLMGKLQDEGLTIFLVEQKLQFALEHSSDIYLMSKGQIGEHCTPQELAENRKIQDQYLGV